jgi:hypothetical protein
MHSDWLERACTSHPAHNTTLPSLAFAWPLAESQERQHSGEPLERLLARPPRELSNVCS